MDRISKEHRSWNMSRIKGKNTKPEIKVRSLLHSLGYRFRLHSDCIPGKPDIILPRYNTVIFVHGCFWHRHPGCGNAYTPKSSVQFWQEKFAQNQKRDTEVQKAITELGWNYVIVWECQLKNEEELTSYLTSSLSIMQL